MDRHVLSDDAPVADPHSRRGSRHILHVLRRGPDDCAMGNLAALADLHLPFEDHVSSDLTPLTDANLVSDNRVWANDHARLYQRFGVDQCRGVNVWGQFSRHSHSSWASPQVALQAPRGAV